MSVAGFMGSQYFDLLAAVENRGSTVMIVAPLSMASDISCTCPLCMFSPRCEPISTRQRVSRMSVGSGEARISPKVVRKATSRGPRHWAKEGAVMLGDPIARSRSPKYFPPEPCVNRAMHSGPCVSATFCSASATVSRASSQLASTNTCFPSTVLRMSGVFSRSSSVYIPTPPVPRGQSLPLQCGSSSLPMIFQISPFGLVYTHPAHFQKHTSQ